MCGAHRPGKGHRGRVPKPRRYPPPDLCYAVVVKERAHGRVVHVTTRIVYGTTEQIEAALQASPVSHTINTYGVERNNLTIRQHARRMGRKVNAFAKDLDCLEHQLPMWFASFFEKASVSRTRRETRCRMVLLKRSI